MEDLTHAPDLSDDIGISDHIPAAEAGKRMSFREASEDDEIGVVIEKGDSIHRIILCFGEIPVRLIMCYQNVVRY